MLHFLRLTLLLCLILAPAQLVAKISASVDCYVFPFKNGGQVQFVFGIDGSTLKYSLRSPGVFQARSSFAIAINDSTKNFVVERLDFNSPKVSDSSRFSQRYTCVKSYSLPPGNYEVDMVVFDPNGKDSTKEKMHFKISIPDAEKKLGLSDLVFTNPEEFQSNLSFFDQPAPFFRNSDFFPKEDSLLSFYGECYGMESLPTPPQKLVSRYRILEASTRKSLDGFGKISRVKQGSSLSKRMDINIKGLPSGNYLLIWDLIDSSGKILTRTQRSFHRSNPGVELPFEEDLEIKQIVAKVLSFSLEEAMNQVASLIPLASKSENPSIQYLKKKGTLVEIAHYISSFWEKREKDKAPLAFFRYLDLVTYADSKYGTQTMKGFQTERGRVILQYGKPDLVENEYSDRNRKAMENLNTIPYEIWYFYTLEKPFKQNDVVFVFVQQNRGNSNYRLIHSSALGEVRNTDWRKAVENNATYNFDRLDPDDRNEIQNPKIAR